MKFLKNHPFAVEAHFDSSVVLTYAVHKEQLQRMIPLCLELDTFQDTWAFVAVAMVQTRHLRPKGFPKILGNNFFLIGYRIFVRYTNNVGKHLRGLYILKSETDKKRMEFLGNVFTHYNYSTTDIKERTEGERRIISSDRSGFHVVINQIEANVSLPDDSPFNDWKEARRYAGPLPHTFTFDERKKTVLIIQGIRQNWTPKPIQIESHHFSFLDTLKLKNEALANAFEIERVPYYWKKGRIEKWG